MDLALLIFVGLVVLLIVLIFTFIKKVVKAVITAVIVFVLVILVSAGVAYVDYTSFAGQDNFTLHATLQDSQELLYGVSVQYTNGSVDEESMTGLDRALLSSLASDDLDLEDQEFMIVIQREFFESLVTSKDEINLIVTPDVLNSSLLFPSKSIIEILFSEEDPRVLFVEVLYNESLVDEDEIDENEILEGISSMLETYDMTFKELLFALTLYDIFDDRQKVIDFAQGIKDEDVEIHPERISLRVFKFLIPTEVLGSLFSEEVDEE